MPYFLMKSTFCTKTVAGEQHLDDGEFAYVAVKRGSFWNW